MNITVSNCPMCGHPYKEHDRPETGFDRWYCPDDQTPRKLSVKKHIITPTYVMPVSDYIKIDVVICVTHRNILCQHCSSCDLTHNFEEECEAIERRKNDR